MTISREIAIKISQNQHIQNGHMDGLVKIVVLLCSINYI